MTSIFYIDEGGDTVAEDKKTFKIDEIDGVDYYGTRTKDFSELDERSVNECVDALRAEVSVYKGASSAGIYLTDATLRSAIAKLRLRFGPLVFNDAYTRVTFDHFKQNAREIVKASSDLKHELSALDEDMEE